MARIKLSLPEAFDFSTTLTVRVTDINYGGHLGNDALMGLIHEGRVRFFNHHGYTEFNAAGSSIIMVDAALVFTSEAFAGERVLIEVAACDPSRSTFDMYYRVTEEETGREVARAKTGVAFYDYEKKRLVKMPEAFRSLCRPFRPAD
jgi:acyl-CoA thioesterase FadM